MEPDLVRLTASEALRSMRTGELSVETYARACLARVAQRDATVRAWTHLDADQVLAHARELDRRGPGGPLHGLPIGVKDIILTRDMPTQYNSPFYRGFHPRMDAACVAVLRAAGALIFGKTDTVEFASNARRALTRNPHDPAHTPGGSSSGSGAAVADGHVPLALGTQTGGSVIRPASFCGVFAMKPTWGLVCRDGAKTYAPSLDTIGWYGRSVADLALLHDVFDPETSPQPLPAFDLAGARIALCRTPAWPLADAATVQAFEAAADALRAAGARVTDLALPEPAPSLADCHTLIMRAEGRVSFLAEYREHGERLHPFLLDQARNTERSSREDLRRAHDVAARCRMAFDELAAQHDAVLAPSAVGEAPMGLQDTGNPVFNALWTLLHVPCVNLPGWRGPRGLPVGLTLTGPRFGDRRLLAIAAAVAPLFTGSPHPD